MKKKVVIGCLAAIAVIACAAGFSACKEEGGGHTHIATHHEAIAATCTEDGMPEYWSCSECGKAFSDAECTEELSVVSPISALGHNMVTISYRAATCTEDGVTAHYECGRCGLYFADAEGSETIGADETVIPATGHSWGVWTEDVAPTKESAGTLVRTCANCSDEDEMQLPVLDEYDRHDYSWQAVAPSCTSDGWERFSLTVENADGTDRTFSWRFTLESPGHKWSEWEETVEPTAADAGQLRRECIQVIDNWNGPDVTCDAVQTQTVPALQEENYPDSTEIVEEATCTENGLREFTYTIDGQTFTYEQTIRAGHIPDESEWLTDDDYHWHACTRCDEQTDKATHTWSDGKCTVCEMDIPYTEGLSFTARSGGYSVAIGSAEGAAEIVIPSTHLGKPVTAIARRGFYDIVADRIEIPASVENVGEEAFYSAEVKELVIDNKSLNYVSKSAFNAYVEKLYITDVAKWCAVEFETETVSAGFFGDRGYLNNNPVDGASLYLNGEPVTDLVIPEGVTSVSDFAFTGTVGLRSVTLPSSLGSLGNGAFYACADLVSVSFTDATALAEIGGGVFVSCDLLAEVDFSENGPQKIGETMFYGCSALKSVVIPASVKMIGVEAFYYCDALEAVTLSEGLQVIGTLAFSRTALTSVHIPGSVQAIDARAFDETDTIASVTFGEGSEDLTIGNSSFGGLVLLTEIVLPDRVTSVGAHAFEDCIALTTFTISETSRLENIGELAFACCSELKSVYIPSGVANLGGYLQSDYYLTYGDSYSRRVPKGACGAFRSSGVTEVIFAEKSGWSTYDGNRYVTVNGEEGPGASLAQSIWLIKRES